MKNQNAKFAFTLPEILIAVSIFSVVSLVVSTMYIQSFQETRRANLQNQVYEDARFIMARIVQEARDGMIDYDEYYNQNVVMPSLAAGVPILGIAPGTPQNFGQNFGRYYSSFFHPGQDEALGFDCNDAPSGGEPYVSNPDRNLKRNQRNCVLLRKTIDRNTGANPFKGKYSAAVANKEEDAFCGTVTYATGSGALTDRHGQCSSLTGEPDLAAERVQNQLYLISADGWMKTILVREKIGETGAGAAAQEVYALSLLRLKGLDKNHDGTPDHFVCADDFQCRSADDVPNVDETDHGITPVTVGITSITAELPRDADLTEGPVPDDPQNDGFSKDFVPISSLRVNISRLNFFISPTEDPHYAFSEATALEQPRVTIVLTVEQNPLTTGVYEPFEPVTLVQTVSSRVLSPIPAPLLIHP